ncbi:GTP cyclohydrolase II [Lentibacter algarum]|uniref:GTP cyclohydrolase II n=1 Tax=Lentibacter algarum TaxID=576131 RepID=UPI001C07D947|nr:GTP cyclohydrolase II [Lentibacter algarum]MBU2981137.1 GTP cyclohydrolase II [Lentibacter algarum]
MTFAPDINELLARARADLRIGVPVCLRARAGDALILPAETADETRFAGLRAAGETVLAITARRAETLKARAYDGDLARITLPKEASLAWVRAVADPKDDLSAPMKGPLDSLRQGEATLHRLAIWLTKSARLLPAVLVTKVNDAKALAEREQLTVLNAEGVANALEAQTQLNEVVQGRVPIEAAENTRLHVFRPDDGSDEHYVIEIGRPDRSKPVLTRLHSACFTGDLMGSLKCDCGPQLRAALAQMGAEGSGILLYLNQEGRGIGLANKMRAYSLQDQGFDTVEANHRLGFEDDERDFTIGSAIMKSLGFSSVRLLTNNPAKIDMMERTGVKVVERVPLVVGENAHNTKYLAVKAAKSGHML